MSIYTVSNNRGYQGAMQHMTGNANAGLMGGLGGVGAQQQQQQQGLNLGGAASGAMSGAMAGSTIFPGWGTLIGGVAGGVLGSGLLGGQGMGLAGSMMPMAGMMKGGFF